MKGSLKPISSITTGAALLFASSGMTDKIGKSFLCVQVIRTNAWCLNGTSKSISGKQEGMAEQVGLNSRVLHCFGQARSIMRQKRRKPQPENTVHKDMARDEFARQFTPESGRSLRQALELAKKLREGADNE